MVRRVLPFVLLLGCGSPRETATTRPTPPAEPWLSDGIVGVRILDGGTRMRVFRLDRYEKTGEEKILPEERPLFPKSAGGWGDWVTKWPSGDVAGSAKGERFVEFRLREGTLVAKMTQPNAEPNYAAWTLDHRAEAKTPTTRGRFETPLPPMPTITIDGPREDQDRIDLLLGHLLSSVAPKSQRAVAPMALSSTVYHGHVFWDADIWVFPALALLSPERARAIPAYRLNMEEQARRNAVEWFAAGRPDAGTKKRPTTAPPEPMVKYPWESSESGRETAVGFSRYEEHITGSVAFALRQASWLGLAPADRTNRIVADAGRYFRARADGNRIKNVVSVDENHTGDDCLYTNLLAGWCANGGRWSATMPFVLPRDDKSFLTYHNDGVRGYKQAAAVLSVYPLQYPPAEKEARTLLDRFESKVTKNGPAMTGAVHATIRARLGDPKARETWIASIDPYVKAPDLFSEKRGSDRTAFVTGAGGAMNTVLYGFAGLRLDDRPLPGSAFPPIRLKNGGWLSCRPSLPKEWRSVTIDGLTILDRAYVLTIAGSRATLTAKGKR